MLEDKKKPWEQNLSTSENNQNSKKPWEQNFIENKKKSTLSSTSDSTNLDSEQKPGSLASKEKPKLQEFKGFTKEEQNKLQNKNNSQGTDLSGNKTSNAKNYQKAIEKYDPKGENLKANFLSKRKEFKEKTSITDEEKQIALQEVNDEITTKGAWNTTKNIAKEGWNMFADAATALGTTIGTFGMDIETKAPESVKFQMDPLADEKIQAKKELLKSGKKQADITSDLIEKTAIEIKQSNKLNNLKQKKIEEFVESLNPGEQTILKLAKKDELQSIKQEDKNLFNNLQISKNNLIELDQEFKELQLRLQTKKQNGENISEEDVVEFNKLQEQIKDEVSNYRETEKSYYDKKTELGTVEEEIDLVKREYGQIQNFLANISQAGGTALIGLTSLANEGNSNPISKYFISKELSKMQLNLNAWKDENFRKPLSEVNSVEDFGQYVSDLVSTQLPNLATMYFTGGTSGLALMGSSAAGNKINEMRTSNFEGKTKYTDAQIILAGLAFGGAEIISEIPTVNILKKAKRVMSATNTDDNARALIRQSFKDKAKEFANDFIKDEYKEVKGELITNILQNASSILIEGRKDVGILDNSEDVIKDSAVLTGFLKTSPHLVPLITKPFQSKDVTIQLDKNSKEIIQLMDKLKFETLNPEVKSLVEARIDKLKKENESTIKNTFKSIEKMPNEMFNKIVEIEKNSSEIRAKASLINKDLSLDNTTKENLIKDLNAEYSKSENLRSKIISGKATILDVVSEKDADSLKRKAVKELVSENNNSNEANFTNEEINKKAIEIYEAEKNTATKTQQEAQPQAESQKTEQEVIEKPSTQVRIYEYNGKKYNITDNGGVEIFSNGNENIIPLDLVEEIEKNGNYLGSINNTEVLSEKSNNKKSNNTIDTYNNKLAFTRELFNGDVEIFNEFVEKSKVLDDVSQVDKFIEDNLPVLNNQNQDLIALLKETIINGINNKQIEQNQSNNNQISNTNKNNSSQVIDEEIPNPNQIKNEGETKGNNIVDGNIQPGINSMAEVGPTNNENTNQGLQSANDSRIVKTKEITVPGFANKPTNYDVDIDEKTNEVISIKKKNGEEIKKYVERNGKLVRNANYEKIYAAAIGEKTDNQINIETRKKINDAVNNFEPTNEYELALHTLAKGKKVSLESLQYEFGNKDNKWASDRFDKKKSVSIEKLSEQLAEEYPNMDQQEIRNALIDVIGSFSSYDQVRNEILTNFTKLNETQNQYSDSQIEEFEQKNKSLIDAIEAEEGYLSELTDEEVTEYYNDLIDQYEQGEQKTRQQQESEYDQREKTSDNNTNEKTRDKTTRERTGEKVIFYSWVDANNENPINGEMLSNGDVISDEDGMIYDRASIEISNSNNDISKLEGLSNWLDKIDNQLKEFGDSTLGINIPIVVARGAIKAMKAAVLTAKTVQEVIQAGLDFVKQTEWYQNLSTKEQNDVDNNFEDLINKPFQGTEQKKSRFKIEEEIQERLDNNESEQDIIDSISDKREKMIAKDFLSRKKQITPEQAKSIVDNAFDKANEALKDNKTKQEKLNNWFRNFISKFFDRQFVAKFILNKSGGKLIRNYLIAAKGATGYAKQMYDEAYSKIYKGLTSSDIKTLDKIIQLRRFIAIDENRSKNNLPDVVHPDFINKQVAEAYLENLKTEIGEEKYNDLISRADNYFNEFRNLLSQMEKSGLISKESLDMFFEIDYQPRMFLEFLKNNEQDFELESSSNSSLSKEQIQKLEDGLDSSLINDSQYLLSRAMNMRAKSIAMNNTNKKLVEFMESQAKVVEDLKNKSERTKKENDTIKYFDELSKKVILNPIIGFTDTGNPKYKYALPKGFKNTFYYVNGVKHNIMMEESLHAAYFDTTKGFLNGNSKEIASTISGTAIVKAMATGNNPTFFITNTPRDFLFIATFSEEYGQSVLKNMVMIVKDVTKGIRDIKKQSDTFKKFIEYGGMMDFLKDQGKITESSMLQKLFNNFDNKTKEKASSIFNAVTLSKLQVYSEIGFRMAVFNRSIKNQIKELGYSKIEDITDQDVLNDIYINAVASARSIMDFNQGGSVTKDMDAVIPYLNAATQGTRVMFDNFRERPFETTWRAAQTASVLTSSAIGLSYALISMFKDDDDERDLGEIYLDAKKGVSKYDQTNYFVIFTGKKTENGQYQYIRIAKPQQLTPFFSFADGLFTEIIKKKNNDSSPSNMIDNIKFSFEKNISPLEFSITGNIARNPFLKSALTYSTGYDFYREEDLSYLKGKVPVPVEGFESKTVEDFYKKFGEQSGMSPVRFKAAVESFITTPSTSPYVGFLYGGLDAFTSDKDGKEVLNKLGKDLLKSTLNRALKETTDFNRRLSNNEVLKEKITEQEIENVKNKTLFKKYADGLISKEMTPKQVQSELEEIAKESPFEAKRLYKMIVDRVKNKDISPYVFEIKYAKSAESKALMLIDLFGSDLKDTKKLSKEEKNLINQMLKTSAINKEVLFEYNKLLKETK